MPSAEIDKSKDKEIYNYLLLCKLLLTWRKINFLKLSLFLKFKKYESPSGSKNALEGLMKLTEISKIFVPTTWNDYKLIIRL